MRFNHRETYQTQILQKVSAFSWFSFSRTLRTLGTIQEHSRVLEPPSYIREHSRFSSTCANHGCTTRASRLVQETRSNTLLETASREACCSLSGHVHTPTHGKTLADARRTVDGCWPAHICFPAWQAVQQSRQGLLTEDTASTHMLSGLTSRATEPARCVYGRYGQHTSAFRPGKQYNRAGKVCSRQRREAHKPDHSGE